MKVCNKCGKPSEFYKSRQGACKVCVRAEVKARRLADPEKIKAAKKAYYTKNADKCRAKTREWSKKNPERKREAWKKWKENNPGATRIADVRWRYGLQPDEYAALMKKQGGKCAICRTKPTGKRGLHVDHHHETGVVRGLLCSSCNTAIGMLRDNSIMIRRAAKYVEFHNNRICREFLA